MDKSLATRGRSPVRSSHSPQQSRAHLIQSVAKALRILDVFSAENPELSLQTISSQLGMSPNTAFPLLQTLTAFGYLGKDPVTRRYRLGLKFLERAGQLRESAEVIRLAEPHLAVLARTCQENSHLAVLDRDEVVYLDRKEASQALMVHSRIGKRVPAHCTALGKVLLAGLPEEEFEEILGLMSLEPLTPHTITDKRALREEIARVRAEGFAVDRQEYQQGGVCVAAPVFDGKGHVVAAVSVSMPLVRCTQKTLASMRREVLKTCAAISVDLGFVPTPRTTPEWVHHTRRVAS